MTNILITTTPTVENCPVQEYLGIVSGEAFTFQWGRPFPDHLCDIEKLDPVFARTATDRRRLWSELKAHLHKARDWAIQQMAKAAEELGANAVIGVTISMYDVSDGWMLIATGTAVRL